MSCARMLTLLSGLAAASAFSPGANAIGLRPQLVSKAAPQMMVPPLGPEPIAQAINGIPPSTFLLAEELRKGLKSEGDEVLEEIFAAFPLIFGGAVFGAFVVQYIRSIEPLEDVDILNDDSFLYVGIAAVSVAVVLAGQTGALGVAGGLVAKVSLDAWNLFAGVVLPGALLKY